MSEAEFQRMVIDLARWSGYMHMHIHDSRKSSGKGFPDLVLLHTTTGRLIFVELKAQDGRVRPEQQTWLNHLGKQHEAYLWRPSDWPEPIRQVLTTDTARAAA